MGAIVVTLVAVAIMLVLAVVVAVVRLARALGRLRRAVARSTERLEPVLTELNEAGQVTTVELAELQSSVQALTAGSGPGPPSSSSDRETKVPA